MGKSANRRAGLGDADRRGLYLGGAHLPRLPGELCEWPVGSLDAGRRLQVRSRPMGNSHPEAMEKGLSSGHSRPVAKMPLRPQMKPRWAGQPNNRIPVKET